MEVNYEYYKQMIGHKKLAIIYGNCQTSVIEKILNANKEFRKRYKIISIPRVCTWDDRFEYLVTKDSIWQFIDLFIYQSVSKNNKFSCMLNTDDLLKKLNADCIKINIINLYFTGYFPQVIPNNKNKLMDIHQSGIFPYGDKYIDELIEKEKNYVDIIDIVGKDDFISDFEIENCCEKSFCELRLREKEVDVKIVDYIEAHYKEEQLFYSFNHPNEHLLIEYSNRILQYLGFQKNDIDIVDFLLQFGTLKGQDIPVYPTVVKKLGLKKYEKVYYPNRFLFSEMILDFQEYIKMYIETTEFQE